MDGLDLGLLILRVVVGLTVAAHGANKIRGGGGLSGTAKWFDGIGLRPGDRHARLAAGTELGSGVLLALGLLTPFAGAGIVGVMTVAALVVHRPHGFFIVKDGYEYNLVLATVGVALAATGPGSASLDAAVGLRLDGGAGVLVALVLGVGGALAVLASSWRPAPEGRR